MSDYENSQPMPEYENSNPAPEPQATSEPKTALKPERAKPDIDYRLVALGAALFLAFAYWQIAVWPRSVPAGTAKGTVPPSFTMENEKRKTAVQIVGGASLVLTAVFSFWNAQSARATARAAVRNAEAAIRNAESANKSTTIAAENLLIAQKRFEDDKAAGEEKRISDRFIKATENLASDKFPTRLGAIYSLEAIAAESEKYHNLVFEVLSAFLVERTRIDAGKRQIAESMSDHHSHSPYNSNESLTLDDQVIMEVITNGASDNSVMKGARR